MLGAGSRLRWVIVVGLLLLLFLCGMLLVFFVVSHTVAFVLGGPDRVRDLWEPPTDRADWILFAISMFVGVVGGAIIACLALLLLLVKTRLLRDDDMRYLETTARKDVSTTLPPVGLGFTANVVWIVIVSLLAGGFALVGYHLANFPYEGWEGMQRYLRFPAILVPRYPFRVIPLLTMTIFGGFGAWLAEKLFNKLFPQKRGEGH